jgi:hypothetical protein
MSDESELWSLPWHALQRSLANGFGAQTAVAAPSAIRLSDAKFKAAASGSWLMRARAGAHRLPRASR